MGKSSFSKGFAVEQKANGRAPMVARIDTGGTIIDFETSFPREHAWHVYNFIAKLSESLSPQEAFEKSFGRKSKLSGIDKASNREPRG